MSIAVGNMDNIGNVGDVANVGNIGNIGNMGNVGYVDNIDNVGNVDYCKRQKFDVAKVWRSLSLVKPHGDQFDSIKFGKFYLKYQQILGFG